MIKLWRRWREARIVRRHPIDERDWQMVLAQLPLLARLTNKELARLRRMAILFMHEKDFVGVGGQVLTGNMALLIALQACLPILNLGLHWYRGWRSILVYPSAFRARRTLTDNHGIQHHMNEAMLGEAWQQSGVILSWSATATAGIIDGQNLVIHEFAHKLDMLNGEADGFPPLRPGMSVADWTQAFTQAYEHFCQQIEAGAPTTLDPYAAVNPAEFFAVVSEVFFETPQILHDSYPAVYQQLARFFDQYPLAHTP